MIKIKCAAMLMATCVCMFSTAGFAADQPLAGVAVGDGIAEAGDTEAAGLSREEKAGQMLLVSPAQLCEDGRWTEHMEQVVENVGNYHVGGLIFFADDLNNQDAVKELLAAVQKEEGIPILAAADRAGSLSDGLTKPQPGDASVLGSGQLVTGTEAVWAYSLAAAPSEELAGLGIDLEIVPGTGADFAVVTNEKVKNPMDDGRPASMSKSMVTAALKAEFSGVVLTDSLSMASATDNYGGDMAVMYALQSGADIFTAPAKPVNAYYGILSAIDEQLVTEEQINASVGKILEAKKSWVSISDE